jgi:hypothetical protein
MIRVYTPYLATFGYDDKRYLATLDRGVVVTTTPADDFPGHDAPIISDFRRVFGFSGGLTVMREYGFPTLMHDLEGLSLSLAALAVHLGFEETVSGAIRRFNPGILGSKTKLMYQYLGGVYLEDADGDLKPHRADGDLRIIAVRSNGSISFMAVRRDSLIETVFQLVSRLSASNVKVYSTNTLGTTVYVTGKHDSRPT